MAKRVCLEPGCPVLTETTRCTDHARAKDRARGTSTDRGYGYAHQQIRARDKIDVDAGRGYCWRCDSWLDPHKPWHEGHDDHDRSVYRGPECVPCNTATSGR